MYKNLRNFGLIILLLVSYYAYPQSKTYDIQFDGNTIHFKTFGSGAPLLIINGGPGMSSEGFIPLAKKFGKTHQAIIYDQRGTGQSKMSEIDNSTVSLDKMVADIEAIRKHLKIQKWVVMGHSFGGMMASYYASKYPEYTQGLIFSSSGGIDMSLFSGLSIRSKLTQAQKDSLSYWEGQIAQGDTSYAARLQRGMYLAPAYLYDQSFVPAIAERLTQGNMTINGLVFQDMRKINFDCKPALKNYQKPVLIIQGKEDIVPEKIANIASETLPNAKVVIIPKCAHYGWLEQPKTYFGEINEFLGKIK